MNLPPVRSLERSFLSFSRLFTIAASRVEKSNGSSTAPEDFSDISAFVSRSVRPFFLKKRGVWENTLRVAGVQEVGLRGSCAERQARRLWGLVAA